MKETLSQSESLLLIIQLKVICYILITILILQVDLMYLCFSAPSDYTSVSQVLTFSSSLIAQFLQVSIVNDSVMELTEVFTVSLSLENSSDHVRLMPNSVSITISDDDGTIPIVYNTIIIMYFNVCRACTWIQCYRV